MSFGLQALMSEYIVQNKKNIKPRIVDVQTYIDDKVRILKLDAMSIKIDTLTEE